MTWQHLSEDIADEFEPLSVRSDHVRAAYAEWGGWLEDQHREANRAFASDKVHTNANHAIAEQVRARVARAVGSTPPEQAVLLATEPVPVAEVVRAIRTQARNMGVRVVPPPREQPDQEPEHSQAWLPRCG